MAKAKFRSRRVAALIVAGVSALMLVNVAQAQSAASVDDKGVQIQVSDWDREAVAQAASLKHHAFPANTETARSARRSTLSNLHTATSAAGAAINLSAATLFPGDLTFNGGRTVRSAESHPIYLFATGCTTTSCWGNPATFLTNLGQSTIIHVADQYTGSTAGGRYTLGGSSHKTITITSKTHPLTDADMAGFAHAAALASGQSGYGHIYHVFLPPGQDVCFTATDGTCYSPDNPATFFFCAYHASADFKDVGHVLYTVEPFQNVSGCKVQPGTPNGTLTDSTANVLSHETFETITDPDGSAWWNTTDNGLFGQEIADECSYISLATGSFFAPAFTVGSKKYAIQREYDNARHACTEAP